MSDNVLLHLEFLTAQEAFVHDKLRWGASGKDNMVYFYTDKLDLTDMVGYSDDKHVYTAQETDHPDKVAFRDRTTAMLNFFRGIPTADLQIIVATSTAASLLEQHGITPVVDETTERFNLPFLSTEVRAMPEKIQDETIYNLVVVGFGPVEQFTGYVHGVNPAYAEADKYSREAGDRIVMAYAFFAGCSNADIEALVSKYKDGALRPLENDSDD